MPQHYPVRLTAEERRGLEELVRKGRVPAQHIRHAHILLAVDSTGPGWTDAQAAEAYHCHAATVGLIRKRFVMRGLDGTLTRKKQDRPSRPRKLDGDGEAVLIAQACSSPPEGRSRWTLKLLSERLVELEVVESISPQTVMETLKKTKRDRISKTNG